MSYYLVVGGFYLNGEKEFKVCLKRVSNGVNVSLHLFTREDSDQISGEYEHMEEDISEFITHVPVKNIWPYVYLPLEELGTHSLSFCNILFEVEHSPDNTDGYWELKKDKWVTKT